MNGKHSEIRNAGRRALALLVAALLAAGLVPAPALAQVADELDALAIEVRADDGGSEQLDSWYGLQKHDAQSHGKRRFPPRRH